MKKYVQLLEDAHGDGASLTKDIVDGSTQSLQELSKALRFEIDEKTGRHDKAQKSLRTNLPPGTVAFPTRG